MQHFRIKILLCFSNLHVINSKDIFKMHVRADNVLFEYRFLAGHKYRAIGWTCIKSLDLIVKLHPSQLIFGLYCVLEVMWGCRARVF